MISKYAFYTDVGDSKQLQSDFWFEITPPGYHGEYGFIYFYPNGQVKVKAGFCWDGASGPTIDTLDSVCASLGHDVLYKLMGQRILPSTYKDEADQWFYLRLVNDGMVGFRAFAWFKAVRLFGIPTHSMDNFKRAPVPFYEEAERFNNPLIGRPA
ncbi:MAG: hypothetical protein CTY33_00400 [Methylotenera sp.]|nr:MAG: hypothetical protein CTY33_00400 [Methylotenera sp.]